MTSPKKVFNPIPCKYCGIMFTQKRTDRKHCHSHACIDHHRKWLGGKGAATYRKRGQALTCAGCGDIFTQTGGTRQRYCSTDCGKAHNNSKRHPNAASDTQAKTRRPYALDTLRWGILMQWWSQRHTDTAYAVPDTTMEAIEKAKEGTSP